MQNKQSTLVRIHFAFFILYFSFFIMNLAQSRHSSFGGVKSAMYS
jgi:hypothetical protein